MSEILSAFLGYGTGFVLCLIGWQINLLVVHRGIERGSHAGFFLGLGSLSADIVIIAILFTGFLPFMHQPHFSGYLKWISIGMLCFVAVRTFFLKPKSSAEKKRHKPDPAKNFLLGFVFVFSNPLTVLLWVAVISFLIGHFPEAEIMHNKLLFLITFAAGGLCWFLFLILWVLHHVRSWPDERLHQLARFFSVGLAGAAVALLYAKF